MEPDIEPYPSSFVSSWNAFGHYHASSSGWVCGVAQAVIRTRGILKGILGEVSKEWRAEADFEQILCSEGKPSAPCALSPGP
jgi:hypothetical protein